MPDKPVAEVVIDERLVRSLVRSQTAGAIPDAAELPLARMAAGWDSEVWRLGDDFAVRLPRRALAAPLLLHEQLTLPRVGPAIEATGVRVPVPLVDGVPGHGYPWAWSVVPWIEGERGLDIARSVRRGWAAPLAAALDALHVTAPADHPVNRFRGVPLAHRAAAFDERRERLAADGLLDHREAADLAGTWRAGLAAAPWDRPPVWIHGDLHPGNLVATEGRLAGVIDFGDVTAGDPAYDLAVAWLAFDAAGRAAFIASTADRHDAATWTRARAWAAAVAVTLLMHSDDEPAYAQLARETIAQLTGDAALD